MSNKDLRSITPNPDANFTPTLQPYQDMKPFRFWCQTVLPNVYDDSLSYYELLTKVVEFLNVVIENNDAMHLDVENLLSAYNQLQDYVNNYFNGLDVQEEIDNKLDEMVKSGQLLTIITPTVIQAVNNYLKNNLTPTSPPLDKTFMIANAAAESKTVGEKVLWNRGEIVPTDTPTDSVNFLYNHTDIGRQYITSANCSKIQDLPDVANPSGAMLVNLPSIGQSNFVMQICMVYNGKGGGVTQNYEIFYRDLYLPATSTTTFPKATTWLKFLTEDFKENSFIDNSKISPSSTEDDPSRFLYNYINFGRYYVQGSDSSKIQDLPENFTPTNSSGIMLLNFKGINDSFVTQLFMSYNGKGTTTTKNYPMFYRNVRTNDNPSSSFPKATDWMPWALLDDTVTVSGMAADAGAVNSLFFKTRDVINLTSTITDANYLYNYKEPGVYGFPGGNSRYIQDLPPSLKTTSGGLALYVYQGFNQNFRYQVLQAYKTGFQNDPMGYPVFYRLIPITTPSSFPKEGIWIPFNNQFGLLNVNVTVIGDSITRINSRAPRGWAFLLKNQGAVVQNLGQNGGGFWPADTRPLLIDQIANIKPDTQLIGVSASFNDVAGPHAVGNITDTGDTSICGHINDFFDALINAHPSTPICAYVLNPWEQYHYGSSTKADQYVNNFQEICAIRGIPFKSLYHSCGLYPWVEGNKTAYFKPEDNSAFDGTHPNNAGHKMIYQHLLPLFLETYANEGQYYIF